MKNTATSLSEQNKQNEHKINKVPCEISEIISDEQITIVKMRFKEHCLSAMLLNGGHFGESTQINALFKESEVMICDSSYVKISARNRFVSKVLSVQKTKTIARIVFEFEGLEITSLISAQACDELDICVGGVFAWFVKSSEVMLEYV